MSSNTNFFYNKERHGFHLVDNSQLPIMTAFSTFLVVLNCVFYLNPTKCNVINSLDQLGFQFAGILLITILFSWFLTVIYESGQGHHTQVVRKGLRLGMLLFIISEGMLFFSFFWAFFHVSLAPAIILGCVWPPSTIQPLDVWGLPLTNTMLLLTSGLTLTLAHRALVKSNTYLYTKFAKFTLFVTILLGITFLFCQFIEYRYGITFNWRDTVYGSIFYVTTGFHGFHVVIGIIFLMFCLGRMLITVTNVNNVPKFIQPYANYVSQFSLRKEQHIGFEAAAWYWHFVDVVWIFLFLTIYWWNTMPIVEVIVEPISVKPRVEPIIYDPVWDFIKENSIYLWELICLAALSIKAYFTQLPPENFSPYTYSINYYYPYGPYMPSMDYMTGPQDILSLHEQVLHNSKSPKELMQGLYLLQTQYDSLYQMAKWGQLSDTEFSKQLLEYENEAKHLFDNVLEKKNSPLPPIPILAPVEENLLPIVEISSVCKVESISSLEADSTIVDEAVGQENTQKCQ